MTARSLGTAVILLLAAACTSDPITRPGANQVHEPEEQRTETGMVAAANTTQERGRVDPQRDGFEIVLGEWALAPEAQAIRPGPVTFVIHNRGSMAHGFEIALEGDSSGHGSGDLFKAEGPLLRPGTTTKMTLDLQPGLYEIECLVDGHDDMGMEGVLDVRADAPLVKAAPPDNPTVDSVSIEDFAFAPRTITVDSGSEVTWANADAAPHTVTSTDDAFDSGTLDPQGSFGFRFEQPGTYDYRCLIHPDMKGSVKVR